MKAWNGKNSMKGFVKQKERKCEAKQKIKKIKKYNFSNMLKCGFVLRIFS